MRAHGNYEHCRDMVQEVSLSLWEHYGKLRPGATPMEERGWVAWHTRTVLDHLHRSGRLREQPLTDEVLDRMTAEEPASHGKVDELLDRLDDNERNLVRLRLEGYSAEEIAEEMNLKRNAVYQRLHRIIVKLREENNGKQ